MDVEKRVVEDVEKRVVGDGNPQGSFRSPRGTPLDVDPYETTFGGVTLCVYI